MTNVAQICYLARLAGFELAATKSQVKNNILSSIVDFICKGHAEILAANKIDLDNATALSQTMQDRLKLDSNRIEAMAEGVRQVIALDDPIGEVVEQWTRPNGLKISKIRAPLGVVGVIYEARPNVTVDVAALCIKSGNCVILRGGKEAVNTNRALYEIIKKAIISAGFNPDIVMFIDDTTRQGSLEMLKQGDSIDVIIPRGGDGLKHFVLENATMPVIASAGGNCHLYVEKTADLDMALNVICNAKLSRPSVCNSLEQLLVDHEIADKFLPMLVEKMGNNCVLNGCEKANAICKQIAIADPSEYKKEHLDYVLTVFVVKDFNQAIDRINENNTKHSDAIISNDKHIIDFFSKKVDSGCIYINASTRFTDGFEFGFGAEIGISTQKLHARGPLGLRQLSSEKYIISGNGQVR